MSIAATLFIQSLGNGWLSGPSSEELNRNGRGQQPTRSYHEFGIQGIAVDAIGLGLLSISAIRPNAGPQADCTKSDWEC